MCIRDRAHPLLVLHPGVVALASLALAENQIIGCMVMWCVVWRVWRAVAVLTSDGVGLCPNVVMRKRFLRAHKWKHYHYFHTSIVVIDYLLRGCLGRGVSIFFPSTVFRFTTKWNPPVYKSHLVVYYYVVKEIAQTIIFGFTTTITYMNAPSQKYPLLLIVYYQHFSSKCGSSEKNATYYV